MDLTSSSARDLLPHYGENSLSPRPIAFYYTLQLEPPIRRHAETLDVPSVSTSATRPPEAGAGTGVGVGSNRTQHPRAQISLSAVFQKAADCADDLVGCGELHHRPLAEPQTKGEANCSDLAVA